LFAEVVLRISQVSVTTLFVVHSIPLVLMAEHKAALSTELNELKRRNKLNYEKESS
jgi:hypothetical protein